jgi:predicted methyltransferase
MQRAAIATAGALLAVTLASGAARAALNMALPAYISAAIADSARPAGDTERDAERKPGATLAFAGIKPGDVVVELAPGKGYYTRLLSATVGPRGKVYAVAAPPRPDAPPDTPPPAAAVHAIAADPHFSNVTVILQRVAQLQLPEGAADFVWTSDNYHDFHNIADVDVVNIDKAVFKALKPGGIFLVLDHAAQGGSGFRDTSTLHRIDPDAVKKEVESAGFKFLGESNILQNKADPHTAKVFDPAIRGHTDQFVMKFTKP